MNLITNYLKLARWKFDKRKGFQPSYIINISDKQAVPFNKQEKLCQGVPKKMFLS